MSLHGRVLAVTEERAGDYLSIPVAIGAPEVQLEDASDFDESGGQAVLDPDGDAGGPLLFTYSSADLDYDTLEVVGTIATFFEEGTVVRVDPEYKITVAYVQPDDPELPPVAARVPFHMRPMLDLGQRSDVLGEDENAAFGYEEVIVELVRGSWVLTDILGVDPSIIGEEVSTDGVPPALSPTPVVQGGIGALFISWDPVINNDPVRYEVYVSLDPNFVPGPDSFAGEIDGTQFVVHALPQSTGPPDPPPSGSTNGVMAETLGPIVSSAVGSSTTPPVLQTDFQNWLDCGTAGVAITALNSGGGNGDAFTNVNAGPGSVVYDSGSALGQAQGINAKLSASAGSVGGQYVGWTTSSTWHELWMRAYFEFPGSPSGRRDLIQVLSGANQCFQVCVTLAGQIQIRNAADAIVATGSGFWTIANPIRLEVHAILDATLGHIEVGFAQVLPNDETFDEVVGDITANAALFGSTANVARFGNLSTAVSGAEVCYVDSPGISTVDWIGP